MYMNINKTSYTSSNPGHYLDYGYATQAIAR